VVEVAEDVVGEELLGGAELAVGSTGWGNDQSRLPLVRCLGRKTAVGKSRDLTSLAGVVGRLLSQEGCKDEVLLLARSDSLGPLIGDGQHQVRSSAARRVAERGRGKEKLATAPSDDVQSSAKEWPTHMGRTTGGH
jgi:hypothetical protein